MIICLSRECGMVCVKTLKRKINSFFTSKLFFILIITSVLFSFLLFSYKYFRDRKNEEVFPVFYECLERYQTANESSSLIPFEELLKDIDEAIANMSFFSNLKEQFLLLKISVLYQLKRNEEASTLIKKVIKNTNELTFFYHLMDLFIAANNDDLNKKQDALMALEKMAKTSGKFQEIAIFYYGYFLLKNVSLKKADEIWNIIKLDPKFNNSPYKKLINLARNIDY
jgi:hypothetical protein